MSYAMSLLLQHCGSMAYRNTQRRSIEEHAKGKPLRPGTSMLSDWTGLAWAGQPCASDAGSWEAAADVAEAKLRALGDACCSLSFCYVDVSRALPASFSSSFSFSSFWEHECVP